MGTHGGGLGWRTCLWMLNLAAIAIGHFKDGCLLAESDTVYGGWVEKKGMEKHDQDRS